MICNAIMCYISEYAPDEHTVHTFLHTAYYFLVSSLSYYGY